VREYCTYFDINYATRGLALYQSMEEHIGEFRLWALCLDDAAAELLEALDLPRMRVITMAQFEREDPQLVAAKSTRSRVEYYFTCTPCLPLFVFRQDPLIDMVTYLDADIRFFASPAPAYAEMAGKSIGIIAHRFPAHLQELANHGIYNVGWVAFRRNAEGLACLEWWRERCIEWCYDRVEGERFADQKYLDQWPARFPGTVSIQHRGANVAPWNLSAHHLSWDDEVKVDTEPLLFFHFERVKNPLGPICDLNLEVYGVRSTALIRDHIYLPYLRDLRAATKKALQTGGPLTAPTAMRAIPAAVSLKQRLSYALGTLRRLLRRQALLVVAGRPL
jgi:hypothetical protein